MNKDKTMDKKQKQKKWRLWKHRLSINLSLSSKINGLSLSIQDLRIMQAIIMVN